MKRIITIQDISCVGKCSLTVALPVISSMGVECGVLPTAVLSNHTAFTGFTFTDLTKDITPITEQWKKEKFTFDAIYTGYLGSFEQINLMQTLISDFKSKKTLTIVDPCMADNGNLYPGFTQEFAFKMAELAGSADVILPNMTEASYMLGIEYKKDGYDINYVEDILKKLAKLGSKKVILKGIEFTENQKELKNVKGKIGIACYDSKSKKFSYYFHKKMPKSFHGTGDIFASVVCGALMRGLSIEESYTLAADFVVKSIEETVSHKNYNWYGVDFESAFPFLIKRLEKLVKKLPYSRTATHAIFVLHNNVITRRSRSNPISIIDCFNFLRSFAMTVLLRLPRLTARNDFYSHRRMHKLIANPCDTLEQSRNHAIVVNINI